MKINAFLVRLCIFILIIGAILELLLLIILPDLSLVVSAMASVTLAIGTFFMVYITYESYRTLTEIQKISLEPALTVSLWKVCYVGGKSLSDYGIAIKNDGPGIAKNVVLTTNWILNPTKKDLKKTQKHDLQPKKYSGEGQEKIGNIASKEGTERSFIIGAKHYPINEVWGVKIVATCEDIFGNRDKKYSDTKEIFLPDAEIKPITIPR